MYELIRFTVRCLARNFFLGKKQILKNHDNNFLPSNDKLLSKCCLSTSLFNKQVLCSYNLNKLCVDIFEKSTMYDYQIPVRQGYNPNFPLCTFIRCCTVIRQSRVLDLLTSLNRASYFKISNEEHMLSGKINFIMTHFYRFLTVSSSFTNVALHCCIERSFTTPTSISSHSCKTNIAGKAPFLSNMMWKIKACHYAIF